MMHHHLSRSPLSLVIILILLLLVSPKQVLTTFRYEVTQPRRPPRCVPGLVARSPFRAFKSGMLMAAITPQAVKVVDQQRVRSPKLCRLHDWDAAAATFEARHALMNKDSGDTTLVCDASPPG